MGPKSGCRRSQFEWRAREALSNLDWLVMADIWANETSEFWKRPGVNPADIKTEVFLLPAACSYEKEGSITNSGRWAQWRYKAVDPPGEAKPDLEIMNEVMLKLKSLYMPDSTPRAKPIMDLTGNTGRRSLRTRLPEKSMAMISRAADCWRVSLS